MIQAILIGLVAGWSSETPYPSAQETAIKRYYEAHASERNGRCRTPYIDRFERIDVVENTAAQMVVDAGYRYRDWRLDRQAWRIGDTRSGCVASSSRRFVLVRHEGRLQVAEMSRHREPGADDARL
jgi:hypothetical protein